MKKNLIIGMLLIVSVLSVGYAIYQRTVAQTLRYEAERLMEMAKATEKEAIRNAQMAAENALVAQRVAVDMKREAEKQRAITEMNAAEAMKQHKIAMDMKYEADKQRAIANAQAAEAMKQHQIAMEQSRLAIENAEKAKH